MWAFALCLGCSPGDERAKTPDTPVDSGSDTAACAETLQVWPDADGDGFGASDLAASWTCAVEAGSSTEEATASAEKNWAINLAIRAHWFPSSH